MLPRLGNHRRRIALELANAHAEFGEWRFEPLGLNGLFMT